MPVLEALAVVTIRQLRLTLRDTAVTRGRWIQAWPCCFSVEGSVLPTARLPDSAAGSQGFPERMSLQRADCI